MDALDKMISDKRAELVRLRGRISMHEAELSALELAARLRPTTVASQKSDSVGGGADESFVEIKRKGGGRRAGDISKSWRAILGDIYALEMGFDYEMIAEVAKKHGVNVEVSSVRDRVRNFVSTGLMTGEVSSGFFVTEQAAERFSFSKGGMLSERIEDSDEDIL